MGAFIGGDSLFAMEDNRENERILAGEGVVGDIHAQLLKGDVLLRVIGSRVQRPKSHDGVILLIGVDMGFIESRSPRKHVRERFMNTTGDLVVAQTASRCQGADGISEGFVGEKIANHTKQSDGKKHLHYFFDEAFFGAGIRKRRLRKALITSSGMRVSIGIFIRQA
jgi:hypothetical protein